MKAWQASEIGEPAEVLRLTEVPIPEPGPGQVLVRVRAAALNFPDVLLCRGQYQFRPPLPFTPGVELCGEVVALARGVSERSEGAPQGAPRDVALARGVSERSEGAPQGAPRDVALARGVSERSEGAPQGAPGNAAGEGFAVGARVIGTPALPQGALAEYALMSTVDAFAAPDSLDDAAAASMHIAYQTGWFGLHRRAHLQPGETLLVHAAAGGVGSAAVQLGRAAGAKVIAVVGGADKAEVAAKLGADLVVDRTRQDFIAAVKEFTGGRGADVVYDPVGGDAYTGSARCVAFEGRIIVVGFAGGTVPAPPLNHALIKNYSILGLHWGLYKQHDPSLLVTAHEELCRLSDAGVVSPLIGGRLTLAEAADGLTRLGAGQTVGRLVVIP